MKITLITAAILSAVPASARGDTVHYLGPHPVPPKLVRAMCRIEGPHVHAYIPHKKVLYVQSGIYWSFVGDPVEFAPSAPKYAYYGHHPVFWIDAEVVGAPVEHYCYITGPHYHSWRPPEGLTFEVKGDVYWYVGTHPAWYRARRARHRRIDRYYARVEVPRPTVTVTPPQGFVGVMVGPGGVRAGGHVAPARVDINLPVPSLNVVIGGRGGPPPRYRGRSTTVIHQPGYRYKRKGKKRKKRPAPPSHAPAWGHRGKKRKGHR